MRTIATSAATLLLALTLAACGSSSGGGGDSANTRTISGALTGDLSSVSGVVATRRRDSAVYQAKVYDGQIPPRR